MSAPAGGTYPAAGTFTAAWNGSGTLTDTVTSGGAVLAVHSGTVLAALACAPPGAAGRVAAPSGNPPGAAAAVYAAVPV